MVKDLMGIQAGSQGATMLSDGTVVEMPLLSYRARATSAIFTINAAKARALLPTDDLRPVRVGRRRALVMVQTMAYTEKTIDPYRELVISIPVHRTPRADLPVASAALWSRLDRSGAYITHIAVDNDQSRIIGREILGFPKFRADFDMTDTATERVTEVSADGQYVFTLAVARPAKPAKPQRRNFYCYSLSPQDHTLYQIPYQSEATAAVGWGARSARLHLGSHPVADELRDLDIAPTPLLALDIPQYSLISNRPEATTEILGWRDPRFFYRTERAVGAASAAPTAAQA